jgi:hypothetical protein
MKTVDSEGNAIPWWFDAAGWTALAILVVAALGIIFNAIFDWLVSLW